MLADCHMHDDRFLEVDRRLRRKFWHWSPDLPKSTTIAASRWNAWPATPKRSTATTGRSALNPEFGNAHANRGNALHHLGRPDDALAAYERALALTPDVAEAWLGRGNALGTLKRFNEALTAYERALTLRPDFPEAWLGRGNALCDLKRHDDALAAFDRALALVRSSPPPGSVAAMCSTTASALSTRWPPMTGRWRSIPAWPARGSAAGTPCEFLKRAPEAIAAYRQALTLGADTDTIRFLSRRAWRGALAGDVAGALCHKPV